MSSFVSGRVHSAIVSGLNYDCRTVTVEWFEKGETKGKEVCFYTLYFTSEKCTVLFII